MAEQNLISKIFNAAAPKYEDLVDSEIHRFWGWSYLGFIEQLLALFPDNGPQRVLDLATGTGLVPRQLVQRLAPGSQLVGLDLAHASLTEGKQKLQASANNPAPVIPNQVGWVCASAVQAPFAPAAFDTIICALATHHIPQSRLLSQIHYLLRPGGLVILADVAAAAWWSLAGVKTCLRLLAFGYFLLSNGPDRAWIESEAVSHVHTIPQWQAALSAAGFADCKVFSPATRRWAPKAFLLSARKS